MKKRLGLENLYAKFGISHFSRLAIGLLNSPGCPRMPNFGTCFFQLWMVFLSLWVVVPSWNFGIRLILFIWFSKSIFTKLADIFFDFFFKNVKNLKLQNFEKIQNQISQKLLKPSFWNFTCGLMWGTSFFMPNFMILTVIEQQIWPKNPNFGFFGCFFGIFCKKTVVNIHVGIQNFAWRSAWTLRTCTPNLVKLTKVV